VSEFCCFNFKTLYCNNEFVGVLLYSSNECADMKTKKLGLF